MVFLCSYEEANNIRGWSGEDSDRQERVEDAGDHWGRIKGAKDFQSGVEGARNMA